MKQEHIDMIQELLTEERKVERLNLTRREFAEFELEIIRACERQLEEEGIDKWDFSCPTCEGISEYQNNYCPNCGQKLIWGEE